MHSIGARAQGWARARAIVSQRAGSGSSMTAHSSPLGGQEHSQWETKPPKELSGELTGPPPARGRPAPRPPRSRAQCSTQSSRRPRLPPRRPRPPAAPARQTPSQPPAPPPPAAHGGPWASTHGAWGSQSTHTSPPGHLPAPRRAEAGDPLAAPGAGPLPRAPPPSRARAADRAPLATGMLQRCHAMR